MELFGRGKPQSYNKINMVAISCGTDQVLHKLCAYLNKIIGIQGNNKGSYIVMMYCHDIYAAVCA